MAWVAMDRVIRDAERFGLAAPIDRWRGVRDRMHAEVCAKGFDAARNSFTQSYGSPELDASLLLIPPTGFLPIDDPRVTGTIAAIERELVVDGFVLRYRTERSGDGLPPGEGAFLPCSFWLADAYALQGRTGEAKVLFERLLGLCNDVGLLSEEYDTGAHRLVGKFPQAFSHLSLIGSALNRPAATGDPGRARGVGVHEARVMIGVLDPQGPVAAAERMILLNATGIMLVVVLPVIVATIAFAWWFRASNARARYRPDWAYSGSVELVIWSIPAMVVILLAGVGWISSHELDPARKLDAAAPPLRIQVVSLDWKWLFIYPDQQVATVNDLVVPTGAPLEFTLTSASVMTAFFVPQLGSQIYVMPGMTTHLNLLAAHDGDFAGAAAHFSGNGFSDMHFVVHAVPDAEFKTWAARLHGAAPTFDPAAYATLSRAGTSVAVDRYGGLSGGMFDHILRSAVAMTTDRRAR
jgi:cytochrome o ubiquinol oxidase subunit 2